MHGEYISFQTRSLTNVFWLSIYSQQGTSCNTIPFLETLWKTSWNLNLLPNHKGVYDANRAQIGDTKGVKCEYIESAKW